MYMRLAPEHASQTLLGGRLQKLAFLISLGRPPRLKEDIGRPLWDWALHASCLGFAQCYRAMGIQTLESIRKRFGKLLLRHFYGIFYLWD